MRYRKKPVEVEAVRWMGHNPHEVRSLCRGFREIDIVDGDVYIRTLEGEMRADLGDWIIKGIRGECYPCKPDIFDATYEEVA